MLSVVIGLILSSAFSAILVYAQELVPGRVGLIAGLFFGFAFGVGGLGAAALGRLADVDQPRFRLSRLLVSARDRPAHARSCQTCRAARRPGAHRADKVEFRDHDPDRRSHAIVAAEGHLVDSQLLKSIFDRVIDRGGDFEVQHFELGRTNDDFSRLTLKVSAPDEASLARLVEDLLPFGCHAIGEKDALIRADGSRRLRARRTSTRRPTSGRRSASTAHWVDVDRQRMDAAIVIADGGADLPEAARTAGRATASSAASKASA